MLVFAFVVRSYALSSMTDVCYANGEKSMVKFYYSYDGVNYYFCIKNSDGKKSVLEKWDKYVIQTSTEKQYVINITEDVFASATENGYYLQKITPQELDMLSEGFSTIYLYRKDHVLSFEIIPYSQKVAKNSATLIQKRSGEIQKKIKKDEEDRQRERLREEEKLRWQQKQDSIVAAKEAIELEKKQKAEVKAAEKQSSKEAIALAKQKKQEQIAAEKRSAKETKAIEKQKKQEQNAKEKEVIYSKAKGSEKSKKKKTVEDDYWRLAHPDLQ